MRLISFLFAVVLCTTVSCKQAEKPLTKEEVMDFAKKVEISVEKRDGAFLDEGIDEKTLFKRMKIDADENSKIVEAGIKKGMKMGTKIAESMSEKGTYQLVKHYEKNNVHHLLFRLFDNKQINYHDFEMIRANGKPKVADIYIYMTGENLSETMRTLFSQFSDSYQSAADDQMISWMRRVPEIRTLVNKGKYQQALDLYNSMPQKAKNIRVFQLIHVTICSNLTDKEYEDAIKEYQTLYPNEPNMQLLLIDGYILQKDYPKALNAVNELDKMIDKDPLLDFHRAMCYTLMKDDAKRIECLERLVKNLPDFEDGILELLVDYLEKGQLEKAKPLVDRFKSKSEFDQSMLTMLLGRYPDYNKKYGDK